MNIDFSRLVRELAVNLQQPLLEEVDEACLLSWDCLEMQIYIHAEKGEELVIVVVDVADIKPMLQKRIMTLLLQANYLWIASDFATLSLHPESNKLIICDKIHASLASADSLTKRVKSLYYLAKEWQEVIAHEERLEGLPSTDDNVMNRGFAIKV